MQDDKDKIKYSSHCLRDGLSQEKLLHRDFIGKLKFAIICILLFLASFATFRQLHNSRVLHFLDYPGSSHDLLLENLLTLQTLFYSFRLFLQPVKLVLQLESIIDPPKASLQYFFFLFLLPKSIQFYYRNLVSLISCIFPAWLLRISAALSLFLFSFSCFESLIFDWFLCEMFLT